MAAAHPWQLCHLCNGACQQKLLEIPSWSTWSELLHAVCALVQLVSSASLE